MKLSTDFGESDDIPASLSKYLDCADDFDVFGEPRLATIETRPNIFMTPFDSREENQVDPPFGGPPRKPAPKAAVKPFDQGELPETMPRKETPEAESKTRALLFPKTKKTEKGAGPVVGGRGLSKWLDISFSTSQLTHQAQSSANRAGWGRPTRAPLTQPPKTGQAQRFSKQLNCVKSLRFGEWGAAEHLRLDAGFPTHPPAPASGTSVFRKYKPELSKGGLPPISETPRGAQRNWAAPASKQVSRSPSRKIELVRSMQFPAPSRTPIKKSSQWFSPSRWSGTPKGAGSAVQSHSKSPLLKKGSYF